MTFYHELRFRIKEKRSDPYLGIATSIPRGRGRLNLHSIDTDVFELR